MYQRKKEWDELEEWERHINKSKFKNLKCDFNELNSIFEKHLEEFLKSCGYV